MTIPDRRDETIVDRLRMHAETQPDRLVYRFLRDNGGSDTLTFGQLHDRVRKLAACFEMHAGPGQRALLLYPPGLEFIEAFLGCLAAGIIAIPTYPPRANRKAERQWSILEDAAPSLILTSSQVAPKDRRPLPAGLPAPYLVTDELDLDGPGEWWRPPVLGPDTVAFLQYTSGSTANPKGVIVTHGNIVANERQIEANLGHTRESVKVSWLPFFHDMGLIDGLLQPLYVGFPSILLSPVAFVREPAHWLRMITEYRGTTSGAPNSAYELCTKYISEQQKRKLDLRSWQVAYNGSEPVRAETLDRFGAAFASCGFRPQAFFPCYGLAEATLIVSGGPPGSIPTRVQICGPSLEEHRIVESTSSNPNTRTLVSSGRVAEGTRIAIVDPETHTVCPPEMVGEIWLTSPSVTAGYWKQDEETRMTYGAHLADTGDEPFLRTGDFGFQRGGELFITGRLKDLIIIRGRNLYPQDIEASVERVVPFAKANGLAAFAVEGNSGEQLAIVIEADRSLVQRARTENRSAFTESPKQASPDPDTLVAKVRETVTEEFDVQVHAIVFVRPGTFPRTSSGKVQRRACRSAMLRRALDVVYEWPVQVVSSAS